TGTPVQSIWSGCIGRSGAASAVRPAPAPDIGRPTRVRRDRSGVAQGPGRLPGSPAGCIGGRRVVRPVVSCPEQVGPGGGGVGGDGGPLSEPSTGRCECPCPAFPDEGVHGGFVELDGQVAGAVVEGGEEGAEVA